MRSHRIRTISSAIYIIFGILLTLSPQRALFAEVTEVPPKVSKVVVFPDRTLVTRTAEVKLKPGAQSLKLASLPGTVLEESITAEGEGQAKVKLFGARLLRRQLESPQAAKIKELEQEIENAKDRRRALEDTKEVLDKEREFLASVQAASSEQIGKDIVTRVPSVTDVQGLLAFLDRELLAIYQKEAQADIELRQVDKDLDRLKREWEQFQREVSKQETAIVVDLQAESEGTFNLAVSYQLPGASWEPLYEARAETQASDVRLTAYGLVRQQTGEDWQEVSLQLSTAKPALGGRMPETEPWFLRRFEPTVFYERKARLEVADEALRMAEAPVLAQNLAQEAREKATQVVAEVATRGTAVLFTLPKKESIASDWQPRKVAIADYTLPATLAREVSPRLSPYAYMRAKVKNTTPAVFLAGPVQIFLEGAFVGRSSLDLVGVGEEFDLFLGIDERIRVEHKQLKAKVDVSVLPGFHGRIKTIDYEYLTILENFAPTENEITLTDQIPVSQHDEIKVEQISLKPEPTEADPEKPGVRRWKLTLAPGGKQEVKLAFRVRHPVDFVVEGL